MIKQETIRYRGEAPCHEKVRNGHNYAERFSRNKSYEYRSTVARRSSGRGRISDRLGLCQPQASKHLKVLSEGGIVEVRIDANRRIYALRSEPFQAMDF